jgi:hypothetical protein
VCKDEAAGKALPPKSAIERADAPAGCEYRLVPNFTPAKLFLLESTAWQAMKAIAHNLVHKICGKHKDKQTACDRNLTCRIFNRQKNIYKNQ